MTSRPQKAHAQNRTPSPDEILIYMGDIVKQILSKDDAKSTVNEAKPPFVSVISKFAMVQIM